MVYPPDTLIAIALFALVGWFWSDSMRARERAVAAGDGACRRLGVQLLDQTVALARLRLRRDGEGRLRLARWYRFDFATDGEQRLHGTVALLGGRVTAIEMEPLPTPPIPVEVIPFPVRTGCGGGCSGSCGGR